MMTALWLRTWLARGGGVDCLPTPQTTRQPQSVDWWLTGEVLPDPGNRVHLKGDSIHVDHTENNIESSPAGSATLDQSFAVDRG